MSSLYARRETGQALPVQQMTPQPSMPTTGARQVFGAVHDTPEPQRQVGVPELSSHHSPEWQQPVPQHTPVVQVLQAILQLRVGLPSPSGRWNASDGPMVPPSDCPIEGASFVGAAS